MITIPWPWMRLTVTDDQFSKHHIIEDIKTRWKILLLVLRVAQTNPQPQVPTFPQPAGEQDWSTPHPLENKTVYK